MCNRKMCVAPHSASCRPPVSDFHSKNAHELGFERLHRFPHFRQVGVLVVDQFHIGRDAVYVIDKSLGDMRRCPDASVDGAERAP